MKNKIIILLLIILTIFTGCSGNLKNSTEEEAARSLLKSLCNNNYKLYLSVTQRKDSADNRRLFKELNKHYNGKDYNSLPLNRDKINPELLDTYFYDQNGKMVYGDIFYIKATPDKNKKYHCEEFFKNYTD